jgi:hypothetical protein
MALYGGSLHLATGPFDGAATPAAAESLYWVRYDWRCELVENAAEQLADPEP